MAWSACKSTGSGSMVNRSQGADNRPELASTVRTCGTLQSLSPDDSGGGQKTVGRSPCEETLAASSLREPCLSVPKRVNETDDFVSRQQC